MKYLPIIKKVFDENVGFLNHFPTYVIEFFDYISQTEDFKNYDIVFETIFNLHTKDSRLLIWAPFWILDSHSKNVSFDYFLWIWNIKLSRKQQDLVKYFLEKWIIKWSYSFCNTISEDDLFPLESIDREILRDYCKLVWSSLVWLYCIIVINKNLVVYVHEDMWFTAVDLWDKNWLVELIVWTVDPSQGRVYRLK